MDTRFLESFLVIAECGSIAEAARQIARIPGVTVERHTGNDV